MSDLQAPKTLQPLSVSPADFPLGSPQSRAAMRARIELRTEQIPPAFIEWRQPDPAASPEGLPGNLPCDARRITAKSASSEIVFDRADGETLAEFQERTAAAIPRDGQFWLVLPEPIIIGAGDPIPIPSTNIKMLGFPVAFAGLFTPDMRYKVFYGGRGGGKSVQFARALVLLAMLKTVKVACCREFQNSIRDSVHEVIREQIEDMGLSQHFEVTRETIRCIATGSSFIFKGLKGPDALRSAQGITYTWPEEAQVVSENSWETLLPTIFREEESEVWVSFNPINESDPTHVRFITNTPEKMIRVKVDWRDNPYFPQALNELRLEMLKSSPDSYSHIWEGGCFHLSSSVIFHNWVVEDFDEPRNPSPERIFFGADYGYADDPSTLLRMWVTKEGSKQHLWISHEAVGFHLGNSELAAMYERVPGSKLWPILGDADEERLIDNLAKEFGFDLRPCKKWPNSVLQGIHFLQSFEVIHIHKRCTFTQTEARTYLWKRDRVGNLIEKPEDKANHSWDGIRYALNDFIEEGADDAVWVKLGKEW